LPTLTVENYVKSIFQITSQPGGSAAATGKLAEVLGVHPGTVTSMLKTLQESGLADYTPYEGAKLTAAGRKLALRVVRRHRLIELFLVNTLEMTWDEVHEEAEHMEHAVSDLLVDRIDEYLGRPGFDPHGDPIPTAHGELHALEGESLANWPAGKAFRLIRVLDQEPAFLRHLSEIGLTLEATGEVVEQNAAAGVVRIRLGEVEHSLAQQVAAKLVASEVVG
jgi:DtxR family Mn-dependent transcriptional regulator